MLFLQSQADAIRTGRLTVTFRRWKRPQARVGGRYGTPGGFVVVDAVQLVDPAEISDEDAAAAGFPSRQALIQLLGSPPPERVHRVDFHVDADQEPLRAPALDPHEAITRLGRMDERRPAPWTAAVLDAIAAHPGRRAADLAAGFGVATQAFKADVRRLKALGLTESLEVGYRLTPFGAAVREKLSH